MRIFTVALLVLCTALLLFAGVGDGRWLSQVPAKDAARDNPVVHQAESPQVGARLFAQHCAECHAENAEGKNGKPSLHSEHVAQATPGQLYWLLTNGSLKNGMPSWSRLPEQQRWQIVAYLKSLH